MEGSGKCARFHRRTFEGGFRAAKLPSGSRAEQGWPSGRVRLDSPATSERKLVADRLRGPCLGPISTALTHHGA
jgi:hypothetical protein